MRALLAGAVLAAAAGFAVPAAAQTPAAPLDLSGAVRYALDHDPTVLARRATLAQNESTFARDHAAEFPALSGSLQNQLAKSNGNNGGSFQQFGLSQAQVFSQNTAQIGAVYNLYNGSLNQIQAQQAKRQVESARFDERRAEQQLACDVATAWYGAVQRRDALRLAEGDRAYQLQLLAAARAQERVGRVAGVDVLRAQVNELRSESNLTSARADEVNARESLAQRIGAPPDTAFALPPELPEPALPTTPVERLVDAALGARADVASARAQVGVARLADAAIETDRRPQLQLTGSFGNTETPTTRPSPRSARSWARSAARASGRWARPRPSPCRLSSTARGGRRTAPRGRRSTPRWRPWPRPSRASRPTCARRCAARRPPRPTSPPRARRSGWARSRPASRSCSTATG